MNKKRIYFILFSLVMFSIFSTLVSARSPEIRIEANESHPGDVIEVPVVLSDNPGVISVSVDLNFNERQLTLIEVDDCALIPGKMHSSEFHSPYRLLWANDTSKSDFTESGTLAVLKFVVNECVDADCFLHCSIPKDGIYNHKGQVVDFSILCGNVKIILPAEPDVEPQNEDKPTGNDTTDNYSDTPAEIIDDYKKSQPQDPQIEIVEWVNPFTDISERDSFYPAIRFVYTNGLFVGVSDRKFAPDSTMTRAMFVTVLGRLAGVDTSKYTTSSFSDAKTGEWYSAYVEWAAQNKIVNGYGNGKFGINDEVTIEQAAAIIARYARFTGIKTDLRSLTGYKDISDISDWAYEDMTWIIGSGIYEPLSNNISPKKQAPRSLVATMIYNFANNY